MNIDEIDKVKYSACASILKMAFSSDKENLTVAEVLIDNLIIIKDYSKLNCLERFFNYGIYNCRFNSFEIPEECELIKEKINKFFKSHKC
jgi:hypothetical protein